MFLSHAIVCAAVLKETYSASTVDSATHSCPLLDHCTGPFPISIRLPDTERMDFRSFAKSASAYAFKMDPVPPNVIPIVVVPRK